MKVTKQRGVLTQIAQDKAKNFLGEEITTTELRVYTYLDYCWKNGGYLDRNKLNEKEYEIIIHRETQGYLKNEYDGCNLPTRAFYDFVQDILAITYVEFKEDLCNNSNKEKSNSEKLTELINELINKFNDNI